LNLKSTTPGGVSPTPVTLDIGIDTSSFKTKMTDLVASYNDTANLLKEVSDPKSTLETYGATLVGDSIDRIVAWRDRKDLAPVEGKAVRLRFVLQEADVFALQFVTGN
jgi:hypothetical protein